MRFFGKRLVTLRKLSVTAYHARHKLTVAIHAKLFPAQINRPHRSASRSRARRRLALRSGSGIVMEIILAHDEQLLTAVISAPDVAANNEST
jgi:hypothetical protein